MDKLVYLNNVENQIVTTQGVAMQFVKKFGTYAIIASLCSACAAPAPDPRYMTLEQLGSLVPDCRLRDQQIAMLMAQYTTNRDDLAFSLRGLTGEAQRANQVIKSHIIYLRDYCR